MKTFPCHRFNVAPSGARRAAHQAVPARTLGDEAWSVGACQALWCPERLAHAPHSTGSGRWLRISLGGVAGALWLLFSPGAVDAAEPAANTAASKACEAAAPAKQVSDFGIDITSLRTSAGGRMVDFRYKVLDPEKAATLAKRENKPYLIDQATGTRLLVPSTPKVGPLRQTAQKLAAGKIYFALFSNRAGVVKPGSKVTIVIGDFRAENLTVE